MMKKATIKVLLVEPMEQPRVIEIENTLEAMQKTVGGYIEALPIADEVSIVCNEEGKLEGLQANRGVYHEGKLVDIICGAFFVCAAPLDSENFESLTDEQLLHYTEVYKHPELFFRTPQGIAAIKVDG